MKTKRTSVFAVLLLFTAHLAADHVILDDCIIDGSMAVGLDSVNGENFGFDTLRLKENNLRFHFDDTSVAAAFPRNDWRLIANDSANGGDSYLGIEDVTGGRIPFRVEAGARQHALYVESDGDVGLGTNNPVVELHVVRGDTPTLRLEQDGSSGWNPQTWDVAGNETNFFIRDVTHGSKLPFRIRPDAPTNSIEIQADGKVDIAGTMEIGSTQAGLRMTMQESGTDHPAIRVGHAFISSGAGIASFTNNTYFDGTIYAHNLEDKVGAQIMLHNDRVRFWTTSAGLGVNPTNTNIANLDAVGNLDLLGSVGSLSDRNAKTDIEEVDTSSVLERLAQIPIATWRYKREEQVTHMGPMAQDFKSAFGLGGDDTSLGLGDSSAVALASAQELYKRLKEKDRKLAELEKRNAQLEERMARIEKALLEIQ